MRHRRNYDWMLFLMRHRRNYDWMLFLTSPMAFARFKPTTSCFPGKRSNP